MDVDDKDLVIFTVLIICVCAMAIPNITDGAFALIEKAFVGLFGIAVGRATVRNGS